GIPAEAVVSLSPVIRVGPSRYFSVFSRLQVISGWSATSGNSSSHWNEAKSDWSFCEGCHCSALSSGVPCPGSVGRGLRGGGGAVGSCGAGRLPVLVSSLGWLCG